MIFFLNNISNYLQKIVVLVSFLTLMSMLYWLIVMSNYGIDFTDESFYISWMAHPAYYTTSASQYGFVYHPLYLLLEGSIPHLRQANILINFFLSWILSILFFRKTITTHTPLLIIILLSALIASSCFILFNSALITPNYNSLGLCALLFAGIGCLLLQKEFSKCSLFGAFLVGFAGWMSSMAKPTSGLALGFFVLVFLKISGKFNLRLVLISILSACVALVFSIYFIDGSFFSFFYRITKSLEIGSLMESGHSVTKLFRIDNFYLSKPEKIFSYGLTFGTSISIWALSKTKTKLLSLLFSLMCLFLSLAIVLGKYTPQYSLSTYKGM
jgi:hypothetical protein